VDSGYAIEAVGLHHPALLLAATDGTPVPNLTSLVGQVISYVGVLQSTGENQEAIAIHAADLQNPPIEVPVSPMWCVISGNLGKAPEANPKGDRIVSSIAYDKIGDATSWLRLTSYSYSSITDLFRELDAGASLIAYGSLESYDYNGKPRAQANLRGLQLLKPAAPKAPVSLMAARSVSYIAPHAFDEAA
jgi:hypothetical protein